MSKIIDASGLNKSYGPLRVVRSVSFELENGEFLAIKGPSGSGKSTLLGLLAGLEKPDSGSIRVVDSELAGMNEDQLALFRRRNIGFVFQSFNLIPTLNVMENLFMGRMPTRRGRVLWKVLEERSRAAIAEVGLHIDPHVLMANAVETEMSPIRDVHAKDGLRVSTMNVRPGNGRRPAVGHQRHQIAA